jgi:CspA family cold shock protein
VERIKGIVKSFNNTRGYGYIGRDNGPDVFVFFVAIIDDPCNPYGQLHEGDSVELEVFEGRKGPEAVNVKRINQQDSTSQHDRPLDID